MPLAKAAALAALVITADTMLDPGRTYGPLEIRAPNVTVYGRGAKIRGGGPVGVLADGVANVTLKDLDVEGFRTGIRLTRVIGARVEGCAVTGNTGDGLELDAPAHAIVRRVRAHHNGGAGLAVRGDADLRAHHLVLDANESTDNGAGLALERVDWVDCSSNVFQDIVQDQVDNLTIHGAAMAGAEAPSAILRGPTVAVQAGKAVQFDASASFDPSDAWLARTSERSERAVPRAERRPHLRSDESGRRIEPARGLAYRWDLGDGTVETAAGFPHAFRRPGVYDVGLTVHAGNLSDLSYRRVRVVERGLEAGTGGGAVPFSVSPGVRVAEDKIKCLVGNSSVRADCPPGRAELGYPLRRDLALAFSPFLRLQLWVRPGAAARPLVRLHESDTRAITLTPVADPLHPPYADGDWIYLDVPVGGDERWVRSGADLARVNWISISFEAAAPCSVWLDGMGFSGR